MICGDPGTSLKARAVSDGCLSVYLHGYLSVILPSNPVCWGHIFAVRAA